MIGHKGAIKLDNYKVTFEGVLQMCLLHWQVFCFRLRLFPPIVFLSFKEVILVDNYLWERISA